MKKIFLTIFLVLASITMFGCQKEATFYELDLTRTFLTTKNTEGLYLSNDSTKIAVNVENLREYDDDIIILYNEKEYVCQVWIDTDGFLYVKTNDLKENET